MFLSQNSFQICFLPGIKLLLPPLILLKEKNWLPETAQQTVAIFQKIKVGFLGFVFAVIKLDIQRGFIGIYKKHWKHISC